MKADEVKRFLEAVRWISDVMIEKAAATADGSAGEAFTAGMEMLRDEILAGLDVRPYIDAEGERTVDELVETMTGFCMRWCAYSREHEPGEHRICSRCPLNEHTVQRLRRGASVASKGE
jgi:hypothetical protein